MQFNSIDIRDNDKLLSIISWLNENTPKHATIIGEKHWRGWMKLELDEGKTFLYFSVLAHTINNLDNCKEDRYIVTRLQQSYKNVDEDKIQIVYKNELFEIFKAKMG